MQLYEVAYLNLIHTSQLPKYGTNHPRAGASQPSKPWALITGATDGLGLGWAHELAASSINVILHGRNATKLAQLATLLETQHSVGVRTLLFDATELPASGDYADFDALIASTTSPSVLPGPLTILINNIGFLGPWTSHATRSPQWMDAQIAMNVRFPSQLTRALLPILTTNSPALILNVSSGAERLPMPWSATYAGAKGWSAGFNRSLKYEMIFEESGVEVLGLVYSFLATPSTGRTDADAKWDCPTARDGARAGLRAVGCGWQSVWPWWGHGLAWAVLGLLPEGVRDRVGAGVLREQKKKMGALEEGKKVMGKGD